MPTPTPAVSFQDKVKVYILVAGTNEILPARDYQAEAYKSFMSAVEIHTEFMKNNSKELKKYLQSYLDYFGDMNNLINKLAPSHPVVEYNKSFMNASQNFDHIAMFNLLLGLDFKNMTFTFPGDIKFTIQRFNKIKQDLTAINPSLCALVNENGDYHILSNSMLDLGIYMQVPPFMRAGGGKKKNGSRRKSKKLSKRKTIKRK
jgi:hypothetical protein